MKKNKNFWIRVIIVNLLILNVTAFAQIQEMKTEEKPELSEWEMLQLAIAMTESNFDPQAVGTHKDYGIFQITPDYVAEVNNILGEKVYTHDQAFDITKSVEMFNILQSDKNPSKNIDKGIYNHNKSKAYKQKVKKNIEVVKRYETLRMILQKRKSVQVIENNNENFIEEN